MSNGWDASAEAWITALGEGGDWDRRNVLDPALVERIAQRRYRRAVDVGCGEGRFCRILQARGIPTVGIDPTAALLGRARALDPHGNYRLARAEALPFADGEFDLVLSCLTLIDIPDFRQALREMVRVLEPGGTLLIANLTSFTSTSACGPITDADGRFVHFPVDHYMDEFPMWVAWKGIRIENWHRPLSAYMSELLRRGLKLVHFDEPVPRTGEADRAALYRRAPWFLVMEWRKQD
jgi:ubiquinone/menaquinone biosynthesis C-methylase UbiE